MRHKIWAILAGVFFVVAVAGGVLLHQGLLAQAAGRRMVLIGLAGWLIFCAGGLWYMGKHPPLVCPHCGKAVGDRRLRTPRGGTLVRSGETFVCPHCGAMLRSCDLKKAE